MLISIIIITLNEVDNLASTIHSVREAAKIESGRNYPIEIIVSDGGSSDGTLELAEKLADKVINVSRSRYSQLNAGANEANGNILLFLHADTLLPKDALLRILLRLKNPKIVGGGFIKKWNWSNGIRRTSFLNFMNYIWQGFGNWLVWLLKIFPGDNAIFVRKTIFNDLNGYSPLWICEDFDFSYRLKKYGNKRIICILSAVLTSTRRFERYGFLPTIWIWIWIFLFWRFGMNQSQLKRKFNKYSTIPEKANRNIIRF
ncbi:MAG: glycosyltransferase family 2 protein [Candidatus Hermodarchaeota archaeon]